MKNKKMGTTRHAFTKSIFHILTEKTHSKLLFHFLQKEDGEKGWEVCSKTLLKLPQYWAVYIGKIVN